MRKNKKKSILVICAHSDDQIFGPGGTIAKYAEEGKEIYTIVFSYGFSSHPWYKEKVTAKKRVKEAQEADKIINGNGVVFLGILETKFLQNKAKIENQLKRIIKEKKPIKIFTHSINDPHKDHRDIYKIVIETYDKINYKCDLYTFDVWNPVRLIKRNQPVMYVDISNYLKKKIQALRCFKSQKMSMITLLWGVYLRAFLNGLNAKCRFAERFDKIR